MASMTFQVNDSTTDTTANPKVTVTIADAGAGQVSIKLTQLDSAGQTIADLRGIFFDLANDKNGAIAKSLTVTSILGPLPVLADAKLLGTDSIIDLGNGNTLNGLMGKKNAFDVGMSFGTAGIGKGDDIRNVEFVLKGDGLSLANFSNVDFGVRMTSTGVLGGNRANSTKIYESTSSVLQLQGDGDFDNEDKMIEACEDDAAPTTGNVLTNDRSGLVPSDVLKVVKLNGDASSVGKTIDLIDDTSGLKNLGKIGTLKVDANGDYSLSAFNPNVQALSDGEHLEFTFTYDAELTNAEGDKSTGSAELKVVICGDNDAVDAKDDDFTKKLVGEELVDNCILEDGTVSGNVLTNDTDIDRNDTKTVTALNGVVDGGIGDLDKATNGSITVALGTNGDKGEVTMSSYGVFSYDAKGKFEYLADGEDEDVSFNYTVSDGKTTDAAKVTVCIDGENDGPTANDDDFTDEENGGKCAPEGSKLTGLNVLDNDTDPDTSDELTVIAVNGIIDGGEGDEDGEENGSITVQLTSGAIVTMGADGTFDYDPNGAFEDLALGEDGMDGFNYTISDGNGGEDSADVKVCIDGENDLKAIDDDFTKLRDEGGNLILDAEGNEIDDCVAEGTPLISNRSVLGNDLDPDKFKVEGILVNETTLHKVVAVNGIYDGQNNLDGKDLDDRPGVIEVALASGATVSMGDNGYFIYNTDTSAFASKFDNRLISGEEFEKLKALVTDGKLSATKFAEANYITELDEEFTYTVSDTHEESTAKVFVCVDGVGGDNRINLEEPPVIKAEDDDFTKKLVDNELVDNCIPEVGTITGNVLTNDKVNSIADPTKLKVVSVDGIKDGAGGDADVRDGFIKVTTALGATVSMDTSTGEFTYDTGKTAFVGLKAGDPDEEDKFDYAVALADPKATADTLASDLTGTAYFCIDGVGSDGNNPISNGNDFPTMAQAISNVVLYLDDDNPDTAVFKVKLQPGNKQNTPFKDVDQLDIPNFMLDFANKIGANNKLIGISIHAGQEYPNSPGQGGPDGTANGEGVFYSLLDRAKALTFASEVGAWGITPVGVKEENGWTSYWDRDDVTNGEPAEQAFLAGITSAELLDQADLTFSQYAGVVWAA